MKLIALTTIALATMAVCTALHAQDMEPRSYSNAPTGMSFVIIGYGHTSGSILLDPSLPIENASVESDSGVLGLATTLDVFGKSSKLQFLLPYGSLDATGTLFGQQRERSVTGFGDPTFRFSVNFFGAPALTMAEFKDYKQDFIIGATLGIGVPLGQYDDTKLANLGSNRWSLNPEIGFSKAFDRLTAEIAPGVAFYTDNGDFLYGHTRQQAPLYYVKGNLSYSIAPACWVALSGRYFSGAHSTVDDMENDDRQAGTRFGLTFAFPLSRHQSVKIYGSTGFDSDWNNDLKAFGMAWQYRFGGGF
ncbi:transporter [soil metagenome]